ncbi:PPE family protein [Mycobacterium haemophilum]|uniref:PPE family protein n=1 Tax=Mycobacterium haemophilum TaxID=29311 RepID=UPI000AD79949|nr:PPE family protein [Mycobacterium haemophilum]
MPNFNLISPEINVSNIRGPGSKLMRTAAAAWVDLTYELRSLAGRWSNQVGEMNGLFKGEAAGKFLEAAIKYFFWLSVHADTANVTARYLTQAVDAYEGAVSSMVPTSSIVANRATALTMKTTNFLGQFTTKIAELDREYEKMWAQNAEAMNRYQYTIFDIMAKAEEVRITPAPQIIDDTSKLYDDYILI